MANTSDIQLLVAQINEHIHQLLDTTSMLRGSYGTVYRRCGKPTCWCAQPDAKGHPCTRISWNEDGKPKSRSIPEKDLDWIRNAVERYRSFRANRRLLRAKQHQLENALDKIQEKIIRKTKRQKNYLQ